MKNRSQPLCRQRGVTLIEACAVLAVTSILLGAAAPNMQSMLDTRRIDGAASQLASDIALVRTEAVARNQALRMSFYSDRQSGCYVIHTGEPERCSCAGTGAAQCLAGASAIKTSAWADSDRVRLETNVASMLFDPLHGTSTPTGTLRVVGPDGRAVHQIVNVMGRVRTCSPQGALPGYTAC